MEKTYYRIDLALYEFITTEVIGRHYFYNQELLAQGIVKEIQKCKKLYPKLKETPLPLLKRMIEAVLPTYWE